ncbi:hypothetical protein D9757_013525 [Collybiopsis confluens]|uniref:NAD(P)-binding protein n=1 Tax=Collybiopsis confluens TaxID=2823264 RepID=A0A8H5LGN3_9AGAR|nr:hypothetical protein D9757_013525 [Collybiopsis confluens]
MVIPHLQSRGVALVTAAARGAGRAIALRLASEGFKVAVHDLPRNGDQLLDLHRNIQRLAQHSMVMTGDVANEREVKSLVEDTYNCLGGFDVMVANTPVCELAAIASENATAIWDHTLAVNTRGVFLCYKYAAEQLISQGQGGRIIGASSVLGERDSPLLSAYSASQLAVRGLTQSAALELSEYGITVNAYASESAHSTTGMRDPDSPAHQETPQTAADLVSYLVSEGARDVTGQIVRISFISGSMFMSIRRSVSKLL